MNQFIISVGITALAIVVVCALVHAFICEHSDHD